MSNQEQNKFIPNSYQTPNAIVDELGALLSDKAFKVYHIIIRKTQGWGKSSDKISTTQIMELSGTKKPHSIYKATDELESYGLIKTTKKKGCITEFTINFESIENVEKVVPKKGSTTSAENGQCLKTVVPKKDTTPVPKMGSTGSAENGHTTKHTHTKHKKDQQHTIDTNETIESPQTQKTDGGDCSFFDKKIEPTESKQTESVEQPNEMPDRLFSFAEPTEPTADDNSYELGLINENGIFGKQADKMIDTCHSDDIIESAMITLEDTSTGKVKNRPAYFRTVLTNLYQKRKQGDAA